MSGVTIVLNKEALNALFPEGSEARLKLADSAIKALAESVIKPSRVSEEACFFIERLKDRAVREVLASSFADWGNAGYSLKPSFVAILEADVKKKVGVLFEDLLQRYTNELDSRFSAEVTRQIEVIVSRRVSTEVKAILDSVVTQSSALLKSEGLQK